MYRSEAQMTMCKDSQISQRTSHTPSLNVYALKRQIKHACMAAASKCYRSSITVWHGNCDMVYNCRVCTPSNVSKAVIHIALLWCRRWNHELLVFCLLVSIQGDNMPLCSMLYTLQPGLVRIHNFVFAQ